ncbi:hypothetical protein [Halovivax gelatinilyticus]|uniref:hypothetical protein n=1 Tax=Halovivax gelatinilyticus TaxID=2961597 RepID=UPI0020CA78B9|nr:hypothetical protein [Halovivax gelatinilyticus]
MDLGLDHQVYFDVTDFEVLSDGPYGSGDEIELSYTITNEGTHSAQQLVTSELGLNVGDARMDESTWELNATMIELDAGESHELSVTGEIDDFVTTVDGDHYVGVFTYDAEETESIEIE